MNILHPVESLRNRRHQQRLESHLEQGGFLQQPTHHFSQADCYVQGDKLLVNFPKSRNILEVSGFGEKPIFKAKKHRDEASLNKGVPQTQVQITRPSGESIPLGNVVRERESDELASKVAARGFASPGAARPDGSVSPLGHKEWPALLRKLDRIDPSYRD